MNYVGKIDLQSVCEIIYFHLSLLDRIFLVDATFNGSMYVEQLVAVHSLKFKTTERILCVSPNKMITGTVYRRARQIAFVFVFTRVQK
jgi:hypothetical protein